MFFSSRFALTELIEWRFAIPEGVVYQLCVFIRFLCLDATLTDFREVHIQDLIKAHEGNSDVNEKDATAINWGKYNMMGRLVFTVIQCQDQCRESNDYDFTDRSAIANLFMDRQVMSPEVPIPSYCLEAYPDNRLSLIAARIQGSCARRVR